MEFWDAYNEKSEKIEGIKLVRGEDIPEGYFHIVCDVAVQHIDGTYLLMQRSSNKTHPNKWELSAGGSLLSGEEPIQGAYRELYEETGIRPDNIMEIGVFISYQRKTIYYEYLTIIDIDKDSIVLQEGETQAYRWIDKKALMSMSKEELVTKRIIDFILDLR